MPPSSGKSGYDEVVAEYEALLRAGNAPDRQLLLEQHPEFSDRLQSFFAELDRALQPSTIGSDDVTLQPGQRPAGPYAAGDPEPTLQSEHSMVAKTPIAVGQFFGEYELLQEIARGGMGVVYKARHRKLNRVVALKMILAGQLASEQDVRRFHAEAEAAATLDHPGIVPIYDVGEHSGHHYFSMAYIEGVSLAEMIKEGPLPTPVAVEHAKHVAEAMAYAHERGVIHRDLKPANVLVDSSGVPKVTDFGLAKKVEDDGSLTTAGEILGTPSYMPPEQAAGKADGVGESADVYLLGALLYAMTTGRPPFQASNSVDTLLQVLDKEPVAPRLLNAAVPADVETIALKCLQKDPQRRYPTAIDLAHDLERVLQNEPISARPVSRFERMWRWSQRHPALSTMSLVAATLSVVLLVGVGWGYIHERNMRTQLATALARQQLLTERLRKLVEFIHNGEKVRSYEEAVEAAVQDPELLESLTAFVESDSLVELREPLNDPALAGKRAAELGELRNAFVEHVDRSRLQNWVDTRLLMNSEEQKSEVFAWFVQDSEGLQIARSPLGEDNVGYNYAWRSYFHGGRDDYRDLSEYLEAVDEQGGHLEETQVSTAFLTKTTDEWVVAISTPVYADPAETRFLGVVGVFLYVTPPDQLP